LKTYKAASLVELKTIAENLITDLGNNKVVAFYGEMGVGKTTLVK